MERDNEKEIVVISQIFHTFGRKEKELKEVKEEKPSNPSIKGE
jgi:hypothetical protein